MIETPLIVTRGDGIPVPDQAMGVELFKAQCRIGALNEQIIALERRYTALLADARQAIKAIEALISESQGVYGLHLNGDPAPWGELRTGGAFDGWLGAFDAAAERILSIKEK